ncbi:MAG: hypothetical protein LKE30_03150 [Bacteroidales bacterium]|jgi:hypothetical protein|nr:hypothetical protein [Bacteroidales bacterium]
MKVIVSHDVDELYISDHFKDLIIPKFQFRSFLFFIEKRINFMTFIYRFFYIFESRIHRIPEIINIDKEYNIPSVFFFGMNNGLGMSYSHKKARPWIEYVKNKGFDIGVHGLNYKDKKSMKKEFDDFISLSGMQSFGIRNHYVRYNEETFSKQAEIGYLFDTSYFNKEKVELKRPYKIGSMWEFPLYIMDVYLDKYKETTLNEMESYTISIINRARVEGLDYFTLLFHDSHFCGKKYPLYYEYYIWFVKYCKENNIEFISYRDAIKELNNEK